MKKTMICALMALVMIALVSCSKKESKQFTELKEKAQEIETVINESMSCDDLTMAAFGFLGLTFDDTEYADEEKMTEVEQEKFEKIMEDLSNKLGAKSAELGCDNEENIEDEGFDIQPENDSIIE